MHMRNTERRRQFFKSYEAQALRSRSLLTQISDDLTNIFGSGTFLILNFIVFIAWIIINLGWVPQISMFDPFPFGLLTMGVSLEAIFLSIFVLVSQNRSSYISSVRDEVHMRVNLIAEEEITKVLELLGVLLKHLKIQKDDEVLKQMLEKLDTYNIERQILGQIERADKSLAVKLKDDFADIITYPIKKPIEVIKDMASSNGDTVTK